MALGADGLDFMELGATWEQTPEITREEHRRGGRPPWFRLRPRSLGIDAVPSRFLHLQREGAQHFPLV